VKKTIASFPENNLLWGLDWRTARTLLRVAAHSAAKRFKTPIVEDEQQDAAERPQDGA
jgi:hypothetical protein